MPCIGLSKYFRNKQPLGLRGNYWRNHNGAAGSGITRTEEANGANETGTDFLPDMWSLLGGQGLSSPNFPNAVDGPNAHPDGQAVYSLGLNPTWDGGLA